MNVEFLKEVYQARRKTLLILLALFLVNVAAYLYTALYQAPRLASLRGQVAEKQQLHSGGVTQDAAAVYRQGKADLVAWRERIPPKKEFTRLVGELFELASSNSLGIGGVTYKPLPLKEENLLGFSIGFNVSGKYAAIKSFVSDLARSREIMHIDSLALNNSRPTEESIDMKLQLTAYFRLEGQ